MKRPWPGPGRATRTIRAVVIAAGLAACVQAAPRPAQAAVPVERLAVLQRGINLVHWFRFPPSTDPAALRGYISDATLRGLHRAGFTFLRVPIQPELLLDSAGAVDAGRVALVAAQLRRVVAAGLGVMPEIHPVTWNLDTSSADRARLVAIWAALAPALAGLDPRLTFPEIMNEPVFADPATWEALQARALAVIRRALPGDTVVLSGTDWSSLDGLQKAHPPADPDIVYAVHFYEPHLLSVGAPEVAGTDPAAFARLAFPDDPATCSREAAAAPAGRTRDLMTWYCTLHVGPAAIAARFATVAAWSARTGVPVVVNEFGITPRVAARSRDAWLAAVRQAASAAKLGWALWGYDDSMGLDLPMTAAAADAVLPNDVLTALGLR